MAEQMIRMALPEGNRAGPSRGIALVAAAAGVGLEEAWTRARKMSRKPGNWKGAMSVLQIGDLPDAYGVARKPVDLPPTARLTRYTLALWMPRESEPGKRYIVAASDHIQMAQDKHVLDQHGLRRTSEAARIGSKAIRRIEELN